MQSVAASLLHTILVLYSQHWSLPTPTGTAHVGPCTGRTRYRLQKRPNVRGSGWSRAWNTNSKTECESETKYHISKINRILLHISMFVCVRTIKSVRSPDLPQDVDRPMFRLAEARLLSPVVQRLRSAWFMRRGLELWTPVDCHTTAPTPLQASHLAWQWQRCLA